MWTVASWLTSANSPDMGRLSYKALQENNYGGFLLKEAPEKVMQFGKGNFLRAFVDHWFDLANEHAGWNGKCCIIQSVPSPPR